MSKLLVLMIVIGCLLQISDLSTGIAMMTNRGTDQELNPIARELFIISPLALVLAKLLVILLAIFATFINRNRRKLFTYSFSFIFISMGALGTLSNL